MKKLYYIIISIYILFSSCSDENKSLFIANNQNYLSTIKKEFKIKYPNSKTINIVFHGHSVPCGVADSSYVKPFDSYPYLLLEKIKKKYPYSFINIILTCKEGENSQSGAFRFKSDVLNYNPDLLILDYALNDTGLDIKKAEQNWSKMIESALSRNCKIILLTPTPDKRHTITDSSDKLNQLRKMIIYLANKYHVGLADNYQYFQEYYKKNGSIDCFMVTVNHPNKKGHEIVADKLMEWF